MRRIVAIIAATCALVALASPVAAAKPDRHPENLEGFVLTGACEFDVQLDILRDRSYAMDFYDQDGNLVRTQYFGSIVIRATNVETDASVDLNIGGPARDAYNADGTITTTFLGLGLPLITDNNLTRGRFEFTFSAGFEELLSVGKSAGFTEDFCALID